MTKIRLLLAFLIFAPTVGIAQSAFELFERIEPSSELALLANDPERFEETRRAALKRLARGADVLTSEMIEEIKRERTAKRADRQRRVVATLDLDGDGQVTFEEGEKAAELKPHLGDRHRNFLKIIDANSDSLLSREEIDAYVTTYAETYPELGRESGANLLRFDLDGDGDVTTAEIQSYVESIRTILENQPGAEPVCILPTREEVPDYILFVINGAEERDENGRPVVVFSKEIGSRATPGLVLSREPVVLKFEGDESLATTLIVTEDVLDVVGLPAEKVLRVPKSPCTTYSGEDMLSHEAFLNRGRIIHVLGNMTNSAYADAPTLIYW